MVPAAGQSGPVILVGTSSISESPVTGRVSPPPPPSTPPRVLIATYSTGTSVGEKESGNGRREGGIHKASGASAAQEQGALGLLAFSSLPRRAAAAAQPTWAPAEAAHRPAGGKWGPRAQPHAQRRLPPKLTHPGQGAQVHPEPQARSAEVALPSGKAETRGRIPGPDRRPLRGGFWPSPRAGGSPRGFLGRQASPLPGGAAGSLPSVSELTLSVPAKMNGPCGRLTPQSLPCGTWG
uniref:translation initiation factor IF-2-like n=1 Tax=Callithrix jacchus TaxID=9483 RepID=UPI00159F5D08|nr:translation initiation factor IF-2-like [Callithrix jacchus]